MTLWSYTNNTQNRPNYWASVGGKDYQQTFTEETAQILTAYQNPSNPDKVTFTLPDLQEIVTFKNTGEQQCVIIYLEYHYGGTNGITTVTGTADVPVSVEYYTISGERVATPGKGLYIMRATTAAGKTVTRKVVL